MNEMKTEEMKKMLTKMYPSKKIVSLEKRNKFLFRCIQKEAKEIDVRWEIIVWEWGFTTQLTSKKDKLMRKELMGFYPTKLVRDIKENHPELYQSLLESAIKLQVPLKYKLTQLGFEYIKIEEEDYLKGKIEKIFPSKDATGISSTNISLYQQILEFSKLQGKEWRDVLNEWGYRTSKKELRTNEEELKNLILLEYPDKVIHNISSNRLLYQQIARRAKKQGIKIEEKIEELGFEYERTYTKKEFLDKREEKKQELHKKLLNIFPEKIIDKTHKIDSRLYSTILNEASKYEIGWKEYLKSLNFVFSEK